MHQAYKKTFGCISNKFNRYLYMIEATRRVVVVWSFYVSFFYFYISCVMPLGTAQFRRHQFDVFMKKSIWSHPKKHIYLYFFAFSFSFLFFFWYVCFVFWCVMLARTPFVKKENSNIIFFFSLNMTVNKFS